MKRLVLVLIAAAGCGGSQQPPGHAHPEILDPDSVAVVRGCQQWAVAGVEAEQVRIVSPGTHTQTMSVTGRVLHAARGEIGPSLHTLHYGMTRHSMEPGGRYVVLLCLMQGADAWQVVSWAETTARELPASVDLTAEEADRRLQ